MNPFAERYLAYYTSLAQDFVREVGGFAHPNIARMPEPFLPLYGKAYEASALRMVIIGQDTHGWGDLQVFLDKERGSPGRRLREMLDEFQAIREGKHGFTGWGKTRHHFWGFVMMMLAAVHGQDQWGVMKTGGMTEVLDSFAWGNGSAIELYCGRHSRLGIPNDYWQRIRRAGSRFDKFKHIYETLRPHVAVILCRGIGLTSFFDGYRLEQVSRHGRLAHYRLPGVEVFHMPHPQSMGRIEGADYFCSKLKELFAQQKIVVPFPEFINGQREAQEVMDFLRKHAPLPGPNCDKYKFIAWVAEELRKRDTFMSMPTLIKLLNERSYRTSYGSMYAGGRGSYRLIKVAYQRLKDQPGCDSKAHNVAVAFRKPNFEYAYSND